MQLKQTSSNEEKQLTPIKGPGLPTYNNLNSSSGKKQPIKRNDLPAHNLNSSSGKKYPIEAPHQQDIEELVQEDEIYQSVLQFLSQTQAKPQNHFQNNQIPYLLDLEKQWNYVEGKTINDLYEGKAKFFDEQNNLLDKVLFKEGYVHQLDIN